MADEQPWSSLKSTIYSFLYRNPKTTKVTVANAGLQPGDVVLDIGCGPGAAVRLAAPLVSRITGVDASQPMIDIATKRSVNVPNAKFEASPAEQLPFEDGTFSVVWTIQSWHHWNDQPAAFAEVLRVLTPGGRFLIVERRSNGEHGVDADEVTKLLGELAENGFSEPAADLFGKIYIISAKRLPNAA